MLEHLKKSHIELNQSKPSLHCSNPHSPAYESAIPTAGPPLKNTWYFSKESISPPKAA